MAGNQGHNRGDKDSGGKFRVTPAVAAKPPTPSRVAKPKPTAVAGKVSSKTISSWKPPVNMDPVRIRIWDEMRKENPLDYSRTELMYRLTKAILPDLAGATAKQMDAMANRLRSFKNLELNYIARIVEEDLEMQTKGDQGEPGIGDLGIAKARLTEALRDQNAGYTPSEIMQVRLKGVQEDLADPTCSLVTVKPPSGYEIGVSKPDARAILISMGIQPAKTKPFVSLWAR
jgi:hypothetical protein